MSLSDLQTEGSWVLKKVTIIAEIEAYAIS